MLPRRAPPPFCPPAVTGFTCVYQSWFEQCTTYGEGETTNGVVSAGRSGGRSQKGIGRIPRHEDLQHRNRKFARDFFTDVVRFFLTHIRSQVGGWWIEYLFKFQRSSNFEPQHRSIPMKGVKYLALLFQCHKIGSR